MQGSAVSVPVVLSPNPPGLRVYIGVNYFLDERAPDEAPADKAVTDIVVWACSVFNNGESYLSREVDENRSTLNSLLYFPVATKGGGLIRPKYHAGDRGAKVEFPVMTSLTYSLRRALFREPGFWGWITPNLKSLTLILDVETLGQDEELKKWRGRDPAGRLRDVLKSAPLVEEINFSFGLTLDRVKRKLHLLWKLCPPQSWSCGRLLWVAFRKESVETCPFAQLPKDIVQVIFSMLMSWTFVAPAQEEDLVKLLEKLQLSDKISTLPQVMTGR